MRVCAQSTRHYRIETIVKPARACYTCAYQHSAHMCASKYDGFLWRGAARICPKYTHIINIPNRVTARHHQKAAAAAVAVARQICARVVPLRGTFMRPSGERDNVEFDIVIKCGCSFLHQ